MAKEEKKFVSGITWSTTNPEETRRSTNLSKAGNHYIQELTKDSVRKDVTAAIVFGDRVDAKLGVELKASMQAVNRLVLMEELGLGYGRLDASDKVALAAFEKRMDGALSAIANKLKPVGYTSNSDGTIIRLFTPPINVEEMLAEARDVLRDSGLAALLAEKGAEPGKDPSPSR